MPLTRDELDVLLFKLEYGLPMMEPVLAALQGRLRLTEKGQLLLAQFQSPRQAAN
jgi:hypothetical protein